MHTPSSLPPRRPAGPKPPAQALPRGFWLPFPVLAAVLGLATSCAGAGPPAAGGGREEAGPTLVRRLGCMGTGLELALWAPTRPAAVAASEAAVRELESVEVRLSTWGDASELAALNAAPAGVPVVVGPALAADLAAARTWWRVTQGAFDPAVGAFVRLFGLRTGGRRPSAEEFSALLPPCTFADLELADGLATRLDPRLVLEEGGFGKGVGLDRALDALRTHGIARALVDLGGQLAFLQDGGPLVLAVADPDARGRTVLEIEVWGDGSLATSGNSERGIVVDGERLSHVLDPRTGWPAPDLGSVTVLAPSAVAADCLSTALFVLGPAGAEAWWGSQGAAIPGLDFLWLERTPGGLRGIATPGLHGRLRPRVPDLSLRFLLPPTLHNQDESPSISVPPRPPVPVPRRGPGPGSPRPRRSVLR